MTPKNPAMDDTLLLDGKGNVTSAQENAGSMPFTGKLKDCMRTHR